MSISPEELWSRLGESKLLSAKKLKALRKRIESKPEIGSSSTKVARLLVANEILTKEQAVRLLDSKESPTDSASGTASRTSHSANPPAVAVEATTHHPKSGSKLITAMSLVVPMVLITVAGIWYVLNKPGTPPVDTSEVRSTSNVRHPVETTPDQPTDNASPYDIVDSATALWAREVPGQPITFLYAPRDVQAIARIRLARITRDPEGDRIIRSLGPTIEKLLRDWLARMNLRASQCEALDLHLLPQGTTLPAVVVACQLSADDGTLSHAVIPAHAKRNSNGVSRMGSDSIWFPAEAESTFVFGPDSVVGEIASGRHARFRREFQHLLDETHDTDHVTLVANPGFLRDEAQGLFPGTHRRLLNGLFAFWSEDAQAVSLGLQLSATSLAEARMIAREELPPRRLAALTRQYVNKLPTRASDFLGRAELDPYWQPLAMRFPAMIRYVAEHTRVAAEGKQVVINAALPRQALHNLLLASELGFATPLRAAPKKRQDDRSQWKIDDVLAAKTTVRFSQKSLEQAANDIAQQVRDDLQGLPFDFTIEINGGDLEPEGITRNQQIRDFDVASVSLAEVLTELVRKGNPVPDISKPVEADQKLVWIIASDRNRILLTTRSAANSRGDTLPTVFTE